MSRTTPVLVPHENVNDQTVRLLAWRVADRSAVEKDQAIAELEGSKTSFEVYAPVAGIVHHRHREGDEVEVGGVLCDIGTEQGAEVAAVSAAPVAVAAATPVAAPAVEVARAPEPAGETSPDGPRFSKKALERMQQRGLDPALFAGRGLVREKDVLEVLGERLPSAASPPAPALTPARQPAARANNVAAHGVPFRVEPLPRTKLTEIRYLQAGQQSALPSCVTVAVPTRGLRAAARHNPDLGDAASALIVFEAARLLRKYPYFNAYYADGTARLYEEINVGFAIDAGRGLKVPVLRRADGKSFPEIAAQMRELVIQYLNDEIPLAALAGGTFTVTDLSGDNVFHFVPLLNQGQSAILGVGGEFFPPGCKEGFFNLSLTFDHQLSEGRQAARFLNDLRDRIVSYEAALLPARAAAPASEEPHCSECLRPLGELRQLDAFLLAVVNPDRSQGTVCSLCMAGWR